MTATLIPFPVFRAFDSDGAPLSGGLLYTYQAGTSTPLATYTDQSGNTANTNPVVLDSTGSANVWLGASSYKMVLKDAGSVVQWTVDNVQSQQALINAVYTNLANTSDVSKGDALIGVKMPLTGAVARTQHDKNADVISVMDFGAKGDGSSDDTAAINSALAASRHVIVPAGTYNVTTLNISIANTVIELMGGAIINATVWDAKVFNVTATGCTIKGPGQVVCPAQWDGTNAQRTYAVVWITANECTVDGVTFTNIPRCGLHLENASRAIFVNNRIYGNYPYASYNEMSTTGHIGIEYDPPQDATNDKKGVIIDGNWIETCIQGIGCGNFGASGTMTGVTISGNKFANCWDHGIYMTLGVGQAIVGNTFNDCRRPIVTDYTSGVVVGNSLYASGTVGLNMEAVISCRDPQYCVIEGNTLNGVGAAIYLDCFNTTSCVGNIIKGNTINRTGTALYCLSAMRIGYSAQACSDNLIEGNVISGSSYPDINLGVVQIETAGSSYRASRNVVRGNNFYNADLAPTVMANYNDYLRIEDNSITYNANAGGATVLQLLNLANCDNSTIKGNVFQWTQGGTNVSVRGIQITGTTGVTHRVEGNRFFVNSASLAAVDCLSYAVNNAFLLHNQIDARYSLSGSVSWPNAISVTVTNANVWAGSRVRLTPSDANAGNVIKGCGMYATVTGGSFTLNSASGAATDVVSSWVYTIE